MKTEEFILDEDVHVFYVKASSFPEGILPAFEQLYKLLKETEGRQFYGLSRPGPDGVIGYFAAVEEIRPGESQELGCESKIIKKGFYTSTIIKDYQQHLDTVQAAFDQLLHHPQLDPKGYCVEMYLDERDLRCMVRLV